MFTAKPAYNHSISILGSKGPFIFYQVAEGREGAGGIWPIALVVNYDDPPNYLEFFRCSPPPPPPPCKPQKVRCLVHNEAGGPRIRCPGKIWTFWRFETLALAFWRVLFALIQMPSLQNQPFSQLPDKKRTVPKVLIGWFSNRTGTSSTDVLVLLLNQPIVGVRRGHKFR